MPIPDEIRAAIIQDGKEGRLSQEEIAAKRLGDKKKVGTISKILRKAGVSTKADLRQKLSLQIFPIRNPHQRSL